MNSELILKLEKWLIWGVLIGVVVLLRHLFPVIFLTFVLTYIGNTVVSMMTRRFPHRHVNLVVAYVLLILALVGISFLVVPRVLSEARQLARTYIVQDTLHETELELRAEEAARAKLSPAGERALSEGEQSVLDRERRRYVDTIIIQIAGEESFRSFQETDAYKNLQNRVELAIAGFIPKIVEGVKEFVNGFFIVVFHFLLSIIFSFLLLWDLPRIRRSMQAYAKGRTSEIYAEVAPSIIAFGQMLGRAFEAQTAIAVVNAILTSLGFMLLGIPSIALLATIVFVCSYIPVFGVILSTLPAALLAFKTGGVALVIWLVVMILVVHAVEAYLLNPMIYGRHLKMHPVAVLMVLLIGEHLFGVWGLLLAVPLSAFFIKYVIKGEAIVEPRPEERGADSSAVAEPT